MIDPAQAVLLLVIVILTFLLLTLGIQVFFILRDFRRTLGKANKVLDDTSVITASVSEPLANLSGLTSGLKAGAMIAKILKSREKHGEHHERE